MSAGAALPAGRPPTPPTPLAAQPNGRPLPRLAAGRKICSSVMLQQLLFYNLYCSAAWVVFMFVRTLQKVGGPRQLAL